MTATRSGKTPTGKTAARRSATAGVISSGSTGITLEDYDAKLADQGGVCCICGREPRPDISLHVDHNHETGELRGLLCFPCNVTIGLLREDHDHLSAVAQYLHQHDPEFLAGREVVLARIATLKRPA